MIDTLILISIFILAGVGLSLQARHDILGRRRRNTIHSLSGAESTESDNFVDNLRIEKIECAGEDSFDAEIRRTIELIGHKAYFEMTDRIDRIVQRHRHQESMTVSLTCGPDTLDGAHELHGLLPGQPVKLVACRSCGVETIDVYFNGSRIGRLALQEAAAISDLMKRNKIVGAYVAEQNCYGKIDSHQMDVIVFFEARRSYSRLAKAIVPARHRVADSKGATAEICLN